MDVFDPWFCAAIGGCMPPHPARLAWSAAVLIAGLSSACAGSRQGASEIPRPAGKTGAYAVDAGGRPIQALETGASLFVGARGLRPNTMYEFRLGLDRRAIRSRAEAIGFARTMTNQAGEIPAFILWYESGVVGCAEPARLGPFRFRTFEEAERRLRGRVLTVSAHPVERDSTERRNPLELRVREEETVFDLPVAARRSATVYPSTASGCLLNSRLTGDGDLYVTGTNFTAGEVVELSVVPNQRLWYVGDAINDVTGAGSAAAPERVQVDSTGRFSVRVWDRATQRRGAYDIVAHRLRGDTTAIRRIGTGDVISFGAETGFILFLRYPVGGPTMDIAGRPVPHSPYFQFADAFALTNDPVWGAVDPTYVPNNHPGGIYAAYYVVAHRDVAGWDPMMGGSTSLTDVTPGGPEIHPVKAGCVNGTDVIIWNSPLVKGDYDVVVDFGSTVANTAGAWQADGNYDAAVDFLDGADQVGFTVADDPYDLGPIPIGTDSYSQDDYFPTMFNGSTSMNIDLRAVVRYPATMAGAGQPVAPGTHPLFLIQHGNHMVCRQIGFSRATCPDRIRNHEGYMRLLDILASHGVIAVSIDAYDLTGWTDITDPTPQWNAERGTLILKHIELWSHMNNTATFTTYPDFFAGRFANHVDLSRIGVSGHSRGGEASVAAYMINAQSMNPFSITSVSSIAPVDGVGHILPDVPYFVILPAHDCDVSNLGGLRIMDRAGSTLNPVDATTKGGIDVYGANHNFFNTVWAADGDECGNSTRPQFIAAADQQRLGEAWLSAFHRIYLTGETVYEDMMRGRLVFPSTAGFPIYPLHHEKNHARLVSGSTAGLVPSANASVTSVNNPAPHQTQAVRMDWSAYGSDITFAVPMGQRDASTFEVLAFRAAQTTSNTNPAMGNQEFMVELSGGGNVKAVYIGQFDAVPRPYGPWLGHTVMTSVRIPLHSFIMNHAGVTLNNIDTIRFRFLGPATGEIYVDDIEFSR
jgi:hypothetical protein